MNQVSNITFAAKAVFFLLCALFVLTTLVYGAVHQPTIAVFYAAITLIALFWVADAFFSGSLKLSRSLLQVALPALFLYGMIQIIPFGTIAATAGVEGIPRTLSLEPFWTKLTSFHILALGIFFAACLAFFNSARRIRKIVFLITVFGFIYAFYAILQNFLSPDKIYGIYESQYAAPFGSFVNRHNFAAFMEMSMALPLGLLFAGSIPREKRLLYITAVGLMGTALLLSGSRGGLTAFLAEVFFLAILTTRSQSFRQTALKIGLAVLLIAVIIGGSIFTGGESSLTRLADTAGSKDFTTDRSHIWSVTLQVIKNNPVFGAGIGAFDVAYAKYDTFNGMERVEQAHNDYLQIVADAGIIGLVIGGFFVFMLFRSGVRSVGTQNLFRRGVASGALAGCFAILVHSIFDFVLHTTAISILFLILTALAVNSGKSYADDGEERVERQKRRKDLRSAIVTPFDKSKRRR